MKNFYKILSEIKGQTLHAKYLGFIHPSKKNGSNFESNLPKDFKKLLEFS